MPENIPLPDMSEVMREFLAYGGRPPVPTDTITFRGVPIHDEPVLPQDDPSCIDRAIDGRLVERRIELGTTAPPEEVQSGEHNRIRARGSYSQRPRVRARDNTDEEYDNYISQNGFTEVPLIRGFDVISYLWKMLYDISSYTKKDCFIAGGYARYCASPKVHPIFPGDVDVYSEDTNTFRDIYCKLHSELRTQNESKYAYEFVVPDNGPYHYMPPIHLIIPKVDNTYVTMGDKETVLSNFDFSIIRCAIESPTSVLVDVDFKHDELNNLLRIKKVRKPIHVMVRCMKYAAKGYYLEPKECLKLFETWTELTPEMRKEYLKEING